MDNKEIVPVHEDEVLLEKIRAYCLSLPDTSERVSHGAPTFFINGKRSFTQYHNNHHGDGRVALWCAAPDGLQSTLIEASPDLYYVPAYVGHLGWIGLRLDRNVEWQEIVRALSDAYLARASEKQKQKLFDSKALLLPDS
ncbi:MmcQ/YjbR family DNA-binding protein [Paenibacillus agricola]|uniref:MmcQ/YjbR family DNA-binding protein n=1 Tax=Paenibacillus agricola TaxID=2716264 RepID=UPI002893295C|nr:MmcQ/YjbR family DNA-binding protein [Paenibacillus agricola]